MLELIANGVATRVTSGYQLGPVYQDVGRPGVGGRGILHAKTLLCGGLVVTGSGNWTSSTKGNREIGVLIALDIHGLRNYGKRIAEILESSEVFDQAFLDAAEQRAASRSKSREPSRPRR